MGLGHRSTPILLAMALILLTVSWLIANPPSAAPDESSHYIKALGAGSGDLAGQAPRAAARVGVIWRTRERAIRGGLPAGTAFQTAEWTWRTSRMFNVPAGRISTAFNCGSLQPTRSWACLRSGHPAPPVGGAIPTYIGTYLPFAYIPSGLLARQGGDPETGLRLGRAGMAILSLLLLIGAIFLLWDPSTRGLSLVGLMGAVTPMVIFLFSTLSSSGPEIAAAICFAAALLRLTRDGPESRWAWAALVIGGVMLALSRQLGPLFIGLIVLGMVFVVGWRQARRLFLGRRQAAAWSAVAIACAGSLLWDSTYQPHPGTGLGAVFEVIPSSVKQLGAILRQEVGNFGWLDSPLPLPAYFAWLGVLAALLVIAWRTSPAAMRRRLALLALGIVGCTVVISALHRQTGFTLQGRYVLPLFVLAPLAAGELIHRHASHMSVVTSRRLVAGTVGTAAIVQAVAWFGNGRRVAVGTDGSWLYALNPEWEPPLGWLPWAAVVAVATVAYLCAGLAASRAHARHPAAATSARAAAAATATLPQP
jgi:hypothetical protein